MTVKVYISSGILVNLMAYQRTLGEGKQALSWNGREHLGGTVPTGLYIVMVTISSQTETKW